MRADNSRNVVVTKLPAGGYGNLVPGDVEDVTWPW